MPVYSASLITKRWYSRSNGTTIELWLRFEKGIGHIVIDSERPLFFVERHQKTASGDRKTVNLRSMTGRPVDVVYFPSQRALTTECERLTRLGQLPFEADIKPVDRFLMERFITGTLQIEGQPRREKGFWHWHNPVLRKGQRHFPFVPLALDIETDGLEGRILSIAGVCKGQEKVFINTAMRGDSFVSCSSEKDLLSDFCAWVRLLDPDLLIGWNVIDFDLNRLVKRAEHHGITLQLGRGRGHTAVRPSLGQRRGQMASIEGRVVLDGITTLRASGYNTENYGLEAVSQSLLGIGKSIDDGCDKSAEIMRMYRDDPEELAAYNLQDCRLVMAIFKKADLIGFVTERQQLTGLSLDRQGGSVAAFDYLYLPRLHRKGRVATTIDSHVRGENSPGGYVMEAQPGLYKNVVVLDFKSLYPSIIRTFCVDPLALVSATDDGIPGFKGAVFDRKNHILPELLKELWQARDHAKERGDQARSSAIKVLMNSFYGVLGSYGCRFFDPRLASSITLRGHELILATRDLIESKGYAVIYGDTDSLFVHIDKSSAPNEVACIAQGLANDINCYWQQKLKASYGITSQLELEFEVHYHRLYLPTIRGSERGSKKRYAGWLPNLKGQNEVRFKGLEAVRSDWTQLARKFQCTLFSKIFRNENVDDYMRQLVRDLRAGLCDDQLSYRKRIRQPLAAYTKMKPPHVRAAMMLGGDPHRVEYVVTVQGPQPLTKCHAAIDYEHYVDKQLRPAAEGILKMIGKDFDAFTSAQRSLFEFI